VEEERRRFIAAHLDRQSGWTMSELCDAFGVSRKTGYKWIARFRRHGLEGLREHSRARLSQDQATAAPVVARIIALRKRRPSWGPRKLLRRLRRECPETAWPARSTVGEILKRHALIREGRQRRGRRIEVPEQRVPTAANEVWGVDFKGWFRTRDGRRCDPLTISDLYSRFLLKCQRLERPNWQWTKQVFEQTFRAYGLPVAIRTDNGPPFASHGVGGLTRLSAWWVTLGIALERIEPSCPEQNGRHERMHRTLKRETADPPARSARAQQRRFNRFQRIFNFERPHEALNDDCPAEHYRGSLRPYPPTYSAIVYPGHFDLRQVRPTGEIKWQGHFLFVSEALCGQAVGIAPFGDRHSIMYFGPVQLGLLDAWSGRFLPFRPRTRRRSRRARHARPAVDNSGRPSGSLRSPPPTTAQ